jgi:spermidine dehydrogenase
MDAAHAIRDRRFETLPRDAVDTGEVFDLVVVGGGLTGLAAALFFERQGGPGQTCLVLDDHAIFGGEAKGNEFLVGGRRLMAHQGSAFFPVPHAGGFVAQFYDMIGVDRHRFEYQKWAGPAKEIPLSQTTYDMLGRQGPTYAFYFGARFGQRPGMWLSTRGARSWRASPTGPRRAPADHDGPDLPEKGVRPRGRSHLPPARHTLEQHLIDRHGLRRNDPDVPVMMRAAATGWAGRALGLLRVRPGDAASARRRQEAGGQMLRAATRALRATS